MFFRVDNLTLLEHAPINETVGQKKSKTLQHLISAFLLEFIGSRNGLTIQLDSWYGDASILIT